ncbi:MAG: DMT family transporter [Pseudomonadota bacterium]|jgi:drug/metabolite transporter (DMT)-like permease|nr:DMT family transporter [Pseudomonadota bacterium]
MEARPPSPDSEAPRTASSGAGAAAPRLGDPVRRGLRGWLFGQPYLLLTLTTLMWAGNAVAGRLAVGEISPMALTTLRWVIAAAVMGVVARSDVLGSWRVLAPRWRSILWMGALGFTAFNALFYLAAHHTTAVNLTIFQGAIPVMVLLGALAAFGTRIRALQVVGMAVTFVGVAVVATKGDVATLLGLDFNVGDVWMLVACLFYSAYTLGLRNRPQVPGLAYFATMATVAFVTALPLLIYEIAAGHVQWPTPKGWAILLYVGLFPSLLSQIFFMRGVELIGPGRAGLFVNLVPVFGAFLAVLILGEPFHLYHAAALVLVLGGIWLAERGRG